MTRTEGDMPVGCALIFKSNGLCLKQAAFYKIMMTADSVTPRRCLPCQSRQARAKTSAMSDPEPSPYKIIKYKGLKAANPARANNPTPPRENACCVREQ